MIESSGAPLLTGTPPVRAALQSVMPYVSGRRAATARTAALASNESHHLPLPSVVEAVSRAARTLNRYPDPTSAELRETLARRLGVHVDEVVVGAGSAAVLEQVLLAVCEEGDEVLHAWRSFEAYPILIKIVGAAGVTVPLCGNEGHDLAAMAAAVNSRTRVVILCSPNNPTGVSISSASLDEFLEKVPSQTLVIIDEAYVEYVRSPLAPDSVRVFQARPNVVVLRTFSKAYGLAGLRVGYAVAPATIAVAAAASGVPFAVTDIAQRAALASLAAGDELIERVDGVVAERTRLITAARSLGWTVSDSEANFLWLRVGNALVRRLVDAFDAADVLVRAYPTDGVRITIADGPTNDRVLEVLSGRSQAPAGERIRAAIS